MLLLQTSCTVLLCVWHVLALCTWEMRVCSPVIIFALSSSYCDNIICFHLLLRGCSNLCVEQCSSMHYWCKLKLLYTMFTVYFGIVVWVLRNPKACQVTWCCKMAGRRNLGIYYEKVVLEMLFYRPEISNPDFPFCKTMKSCLSIYVVNYIPLLVISVFSFCTITYLCVIKFFKHDWFYTHTHWMDSLCVLYNSKWWKFQRADAVQKSITNDFGVF